MMKPRFGTRTLIVVVTVAGVLCAWIGMHTRAAREQREAVAELRSHGAMVCYDYMVFVLDDCLSENPDAVPEPGMLRSLLGDDYLSKVASIRAFDFSDEQMQQAFSVRDVELAARFPGLQLFACGRRAINASC